MPTLRDRIATYLCKLIDAELDTSINVTRETIFLLQTLSNPQMAAIIETLKIMQLAIKQGMPLTNPAQLAPALAVFGPDHNWIANLVMATSDAIVKIQMQKLQASFKEPLLSIRINKLASQVQSVQATTPIQEPKILALLTQLNNELTIAKTTLRDMNRTGNFDIAERKRIMHITGARSGQRFAAAIDNELQKECIPLLVYLQCDNTLTAEQIGKLLRIFDVAFGGGVGEQIINLSKIIKATYHEVLTEFAHLETPATSTTRLGV